MHVRPAMFSNEDPRHLAAAYLQNQHCCGLDLSYEQIERTDLEGVNHIKAFLKDSSLIKCRISQKIRTQDGYDVAPVCTAV